MHEDARKLVIVIGAALALVGGLTVSAALAAMHRTCTPPPECQTQVCPWHCGDLAILSAEQLVLVGFAIILLGLGIILAADAVRVAMPPTQSEYERILERIERVGRRLD